MKLGFDTLGVRRIVADCNALNRGSYRIMELIGMRREAHLSNLTVVIVRLTMNGVIDINMLF